MNGTAPEPSLRFSDDEVLAFAESSADRNPLHVDEAHARHTHFGRRVVHGVLTVLETARAAVPDLDRPIRSIDIEFRNAVLIGETYRPSAATEDGALVIGLRAGDQLVLSMRAGFDPPAPPAVDLDWAQSPLQDVRNTALARELEELTHGVVVTGRYTGSVPKGLDLGRALSPTAARVLALSSYVTGMEVPGLAVPLHPHHLGFPRGGAGRRGAALSREDRALRYEVPTPRHGTDGRHGGRTACRHRTASQLCPLQPRAHGPVAR